ncbi:MAG: class I SAM-dependent methyltransferase [Gammaproteobacteria bacterium]|nr:class I SAM-dependent methyltransferase [Gammaproteobacteria bacterium]
MPKVNYGHKAWFEDQYRGSAQDPWGLDWRPSQEMRYERKVRLLSKMTEGRSNLSVLDIGCATGIFTHKLEVALGERCRRIIGCDFSEQAIERARARYPEIEFEISSLEECSERYAGSIDVVSFLEVFYYIDDEKRREALRSLKNLLTDDGIVLISSMVAKPPYLTAAELRARVAEEFDILEVGEMHLKVLSTLEKTALKASKLMGVKDSRALKWLSRSISPPRAGKIEQISRRLFGTASVSNAFVVAKKPSG